MSVGWFVYDVTTLGARHTFDLTVAAALSRNSGVKLYVKRNGKRRLTITSNVNTGCFDVRLWDVGVDLGRP